MVVRISGSAGISFNDEPFATEPFVTSALEDIPVFQKKIAAFTGDGTWTVPAGVTYAIAHMLGGGSGAFGRDSGTNSSQGANGGASSVAFASGTVTSLGGVANKNNPNFAGSGNTLTGTDAAANSGKPGGQIENPGASTSLLQSNGVPGASEWTVAGASVTPAETINVTVGAGGLGGGSVTKGGDGGSGYVYIEYYEEI